MPIEIRELIIKATVNDPQDFKGETTGWAAGADAGDPSPFEPRGEDIRLRQLVAAQLERVLPEYVEQCLSRDPYRGFPEQALTEQVMQILARIKER